MPQSEDEKIRELIETLEEALVGRLGAPSPPRDLRLPTPWDSNAVDRLRTCYPTYAHAIDILSKGPGRWLEELLDQFEYDPLVSLWIDSRVKRQDGEAVSAGKIDIPRVVWALVSRAAQVAS